MRTLIISLAAAAAIAASAAPAFAQPPDPCHAPAHVAAIVWHPSLAADVAAQSATHGQLPCPRTPSRARRRAAGPMLTTVLTRIVLTIAPQTTDTAPGLSQAKRSS